MTGFARETAESGLGVLTWELRAVNHRYLDVQLRLPDELKAYEHAFRKQIGRRLKRGKVECSFWLKSPPDSAASIELDLGLVRTLSARIAELAAELPRAGEVDPTDILRWPGVIRHAEIDVEPLFEAAGSLLDVAVDALVAMRRSEGERIRELLDARLDDIGALGSGVRERLPAVLDAIRAKQRERLDKLDVKADPERLEAELALIAQKLDVDEELDRLDSHVTEVRETLARDEAVGRRLDFLIQELNREANTLASKSADAETTRAAVELKVLIEQMREQVQNVE
jgi:uncharacterized protein (TIGR00255 family)